MRVDNDENIGLNETTNSTYNDRHAAVVIQYFIKIFRLNNERTRNRKK